jgi:hypothetical protein
MCWVFSDQVVESVSLRLAGAKATSSRGLIRRACIGLLYRATIRIRFIAPLRDGVASPSWFSAND